MIDSNTNNCCDNYNQKQFFHLTNIQWKICDNCDLIYQSSNNDKFKQVKDIQFDNFKVAGEKEGKNEFLSILNKLKKIFNFIQFNFF